MSKASVRLYAGLVAIGIGVAAIAVLGYIREAPSRPCGEPPGPFLAQSGKVELSLAKTLAVFKGEEKPEVIDVIPAEARSIQMVGFLSCMASERGLINDNAELLEYTQMLTSVVEKRAIMVRHVGLLGDLVRHLQAAEEEKFSIVLEDPRLTQFWVDETRAVDWPKWATKFCNSYPCLACSSEGVDLLELRIGVAHALEKTSNSEASDIYACETTL